MKEQRLVFGVYPGGEAGSDEGVVRGRPDEPSRVLERVRELQGERARFVVRAYERYSDASAPSRYPRSSPAGYESLLGEGRQLDLVLMFQSARGDVPGYVGFVRQLVRQHAPQLHCVQVTEEANFADGPDAIDGPYPRVRHALVAGVLAAREELDRAGLRSVPVGFSSTPTFRERASFWAELAALGGAAWRSAIGYVALDFFPDLFAPAAPDGSPGDVRDCVRGILRTLRGEWMRAAGLGREVAIHVGEHGWPTGAGRSYARQAQVIEAVVRAVHDLRDECHVTRYTAFALRDADSHSAGPGDFWHQFGLLRDDYEPKPAFETLRRLIAELG